MSLFSLFYGVSLEAFKILSLTRPWKFSLVCDPMRRTSTSAPLCLSVIALLQLFVFFGNLVPVSPNLISDMACKIVDCGFGNCTEGSGLIPFECVCKPGWKQIEIGSVVLPPCILPNCTLDSSCGNAAPPPPPHPPAFNLTDPCSYTLCGEGTCVRTGTAYRCDCNEGSANVLNMTGLPCFRECVYAADCNGLGLGLTPAPPALPPPTPVTSNSGQPGTSTEKSFSGKHEVITVLVLVAMFIPWL